MSIMRAEEEVCQMPRTSDMTEASDSFEVSVH